MLDERAAYEANKLGHGGIKYINELLEVSPNTIKEGNRDLDD